MKNSSPHTEQMLLLVAYGHKSKKARNYVLTRAQAEDFGTEEGVLIRKRADALLHHGRALPDPRQMAEDAALTPSAQKFIRANADKRRKARHLSVGKIKAALHTLHHYRKGRLLNEGLTEVAEVCKGKTDEDDIERAVQKLSDTVAGLRQKRQRQSMQIGKGHTDKEAKEFIKRITRYNPGRVIHSGIPWIDTNLGGYNRGDLVVISAPPSGGKSTLMCQLSIAQYLAGYNIAQVNLEMSEDQVWERVVANITNTDHTVIRKKRGITKQQKIELYKKWQQFAVKHGEKHGCVFRPWFVSDHNYKPYNIELELGPYGYDTIYIDYLTLFSMQGFKEMWQAQKEYSRYLKLLAGRLHCVIVVLTQLSEDFKVKYGKGPEEDADWWFWWPWTDEEKETGNVGIHLAKARHGRTGLIKAQFELSKMRIHLGGLEASMTGMKRADEIKTKDTSWSEDAFDY